MIPNFLLGYGERLTSPIDLKHPGGPKKHPYTYEEAKFRLSQQLQSTLQKMHELPDGACPRDEVVASITLHPAYLGKSYYPESLLREANLRAIGSKSVEIIPEKTFKNKSKPILTSSLFVSSKRSAFKDWTNAVLS